MSGELGEYYKAGKLILFAGAGVSANLNLPTWDQLIEHIAMDLGYDPTIFATYGTPLALAEFYKKQKGSLGPLRSWMDREWHSAEIDIRDSEIHRLLARGNFPRIYTTNYDRWIERAHDAFDVPYSKVANVGDMVHLANYPRHIVKLHGDFDDDTSLVLDETSYFRRIDFNSPLDIKLRHDALGSSILFVGYSLSDINIRLMFYNLNRMWQDSALASVRPKSYLFTHRPNPVAQEVLSHWGIEMIVADEDDPGEALKLFLQELVL